VAAKRILYVNFNPAALVRDEQSLLRIGYEVHTVFGIDGVMACQSIAECGGVSIDAACPVEDREALVRWLEANFPTVAILSAD